MIYFRELFLSAHHQGFMPKRDENPFFKRVPYSWYEDAIYYSKLSAISLELVILYEEEVKKIIGGNL